LREKLTLLSPRKAAAFVTTLSRKERDALEADWPVFAHGHQKPPELAPNGAPWVTWLIIGGRGAGKTRAGAEWVRALAASPRQRIALVGGSEHEVREVMIEGVSGLLAVHPRGARPEWIPSRRRLEWRNGSVAEAFSADDPESLRGPQFHAAWCDEIAKWREAEKAFDMLQFALRLGLNPRQVITTTPRPIPLIKRLMADPSSAVTRAGTIVNAGNLSPVFLSTVVARYAGTQLGRQEIDGELIEDRADALWPRTLIEQCRVTAAPDLTRVVVAVDPPGTSRRGANACGIVAAGRAENGWVYVLEDASAAGLSPSGWASKAIALYRRLQADMLIAEVNMGGEMVRSVLREVDASVPVREVHATRGKYLRAEPVAALYEQGKAKHVGCFPLLEDEMCDFGPEGLSSGRSPDRLDALVWAITALAIKPRAEPRIRML
jgi:phage terminase large subunit-like protein